MSAAAGQHAAAPGAGRGVTAASMLGARDRAARYRNGVRAPDRFDLPPEPFDPATAQQRFASTFGTFPNGDPYLLITYA